MVWRRHRCLRGWGGAGVISVVLLLLGAVTTAVGLALVVSGATPHDGSFDTELLTPGMVAVVGGLILIGIALAVRELRRIEQALLARPIPRPRPAEAPVLVGEPAHTAARLAFPAKPKAGQLTPMAPAVAAEPVEELSPERLRSKYPTVARLERGAEPERGSPVPQAPIPAEANEGDVKDASVVARLDAKPRPPTVTPERAKRTVLNAIWQRGPRREARAAAIQPAIEPVALAHEDAEATALVSEPAAATVTMPAAPITAAPVAATSVGGPPAAPVSAVPVSILKSGVVEGMAYTLYSDGSIEAQLPQGTLRFGSITALRDHIENAS